MESVPNTSRFSNLSHNAQLDRLLQQIESQVQTAKSDADLVDAISLLDRMPKPIRYKSGWGKTAAIYSSYLFVILAVLALLLSAGTEIIVLCLGMAIFSHMAGKISQGNETDRLVHLSEQIHQRSRLFDYGLQIEDKPDLSIYKILPTQFRIFEYHSIYMKIQCLLAGTYDGEEHSFPYQYFHITSSDREQNKQHTPKSRSGFIVPFKHVKELRISDKTLKLFQPSWNSGSPGFNQRFSVQASSDMEVAKFLKPALLKEIEEAGKVLSFMDLEFNKSGNLCFSFDDATTLNGMRRTGLHDPEAFKKEILEHNHMVNLDAALEFLHLLMKYSDNNFE